MGVQLLFSVAADEAVQHASHAGGVYAQLLEPLPLEAKWLAVLLPATAPAQAFSLQPHGCCLNRCAPLPLSIRQP